MKNYLRRINGPLKTSDLWWLAAIVIFVADDSWPGWIGYICLGVSALCSLVLQPLGQAYEEEARS